jgi:hypothetical protein
MSLNLTKKLKVLILILLITKYKQNNNIMSNDHITITAIPDTGLGKSC